MENKTNFLGETTEVRRAKAASRKVAVTKWLENQDKCEMKQIRTPKGIKRVEMNYSLSDDCWILSLTIDNSYAFKKCVTWRKKNYQECKASFDSLFESYVKSDNFNENI